MPPCARGSRPGTIVLNSCKTSSVGVRVARASVDKDLLRCLWYRASAPLSGGRVGTTGAAHGYAPTPFQDKSRSPAGIILSEVEIDKGN